MTHVALTIAGSDPSGGAGLQADLKTFQQHGVYGMSVITLLTAQNTQQVSALRTLDVDFALAQLETVLSDIPPAAAKTAHLGNREMIEAISCRAADFDFPLVVDPVMISKHGAALLDEAAIDSLVHLLLPRTTSHPQSLRGSPNNWIANQDGQRSDSRGRSHCASRCSLRAGQGRHRHAVGGNGCPLVRWKSPTI